MGKMTDFELQSNPAHETLREFLFREPLSSVLLWPQGGLVGLDPWFGRFIESYHSDLNHALVGRPAQSGGVAPDLLCKAMPAVGSFLWSRGVARNDAANLGLGFLQFFYK